MLLEKYEYQPSLFSVLGRGVDHHFRFYVGDKSWSSLVFIVVGTANSNLLTRSAGVQINNGDAARAAVIINITLCDVDSKSLDCEVKGGC